MQVLWNLNQWPVGLMKGSSMIFFDLCGYTSDCATHEKEKNYHENTKGKSSDGLMKCQKMNIEHRTSNIER